MAKYVIVCKYSGRKTGEYFMNIDEDGSWWASEKVDNAQKFDNWLDADKCYSQIDEKAARLGIFICIVEL